MLGLLIFLGLIVFIALCFIIRNKTYKGSPVFSDPYIPDGEFLHYVNYYEGKKYVDLYVVTEKETGKDGKIYYHSYVEHINVNDNRKPSSDYKSWPSFVISDPVSGSTVHGEANVPENILNNWAGFEGLVQSHIKVDYEKGTGQYYMKYMEEGKSRELKGGLEKIDKRFPSSCHLGTIFMQTRFADYKSGGLQATINPVYLSLPARYRYKVAAEMEMTTGAGTFKVSKFVTSALTSLISTPSVFKMITRFAPRPGEPVRKAAGRFAVYVEDSERHLTVKMENTAGLAGDYVLEEVSDVKSHELFK